MVKIAYAIVHLHKLCKFTRRQNETLVALRVYTSSTRRKYYNKNIKIYQPRIVICSHFMSEFGSSLVVWTEIYSIFSGPSNAISSHFTTTRAAKGRGVGLSDACWTPVLKWGLVIYAMMYLAE